MLPKPRSGVREWPRASALGLKLAGTRALEGLVPHCTRRLWADALGYCLTPPRGQQILTPWSLPSRSQASPAKELAVSCLTLECTIFYNGSSTREYGLDHTTDFPALISAVVHAHVMGFRANRLLPVWIKDYEIRIRSNGNSALPRKQTENLCGGSRG